MKIKLYIVLIASFVFSFSSCYKENLLIDDTIKPEPKETSSNPLMDRGDVNENGYDIGCFTVLFPFNLSIDGEKYAIDTPNDLNTILFDSSLSNKFIDFIYPINVLDDNQSKTISNGEELGNLFANCIPVEGWEQGFPAFLLSEENSCYELKYPVNLLNDKNQSIVANDKIEFINYLAENPFLTFKFPITINKIETNDKIEVDSEGKLYNLLIECEQLYNPDSIFTTCFDSIQIACYILDYPINYYDQNGDIRIAQDINEMNVALLSGNFYDFALPMRLIDDEGNLNIVQNELELDSAIINCFQQNPIDFELQQLWNYHEMNKNCYDLIYPINISYIDTLVTNQLNNEEELLEELFNPFDTKIIYPLYVFDLSNNKKVTFNNFDEMMNFITKCQ